MINNFKLPSLGIEFNQYLKLITHALFVLRKQELKNNNRKVNESNRALVVFISLYKASLAYETLK